MEVICKPVGPLQANCYIVLDQGHALVIDPGAEAEELDRLIQALGAKIDGILLTHAHFDHIGAVDQLIDIYHCDVYLNPAEYDYLEKPEKNTSASFFGIPKLTQNAKPVKLNEGENKIGSFEVRAFFTPGHSAGSTIFLIGDNLFTGDVLFRDSIGRTDLPGGNADEMRQSLDFLKSLNKNYTVYPGHGPSTSLDEEKARNPYLLYSMF